MNWYLLAFLFGVGFAITWKSWDWLANMGRAFRCFCSNPDYAESRFQFYRGAFEPLSALSDWYKDYLAFRELGYDIKPYAAEGRK